MKIRIDDISEGGLEVNADSLKDVWIKDLLFEVFGKDKLKEGDGGRLNIQLFRSDRNITIVGGVAIKWHPNCDRCLGEFSKYEQVAVHQVMVPEYEGKKKAGKKDDSQVEDEDFGVYHGNEIDLTEIIREYLILAMHMVNVCKEGCKGLCQKCGKNLNNGPCKCKTVKKAKSPFSVLKKLT